MAYGNSVYDIYYDDLGDVDAFNDGTSAVAAEPVPEETPVIKKKPQHKGKKSKNTSGKNTGKNTGVQKHTKPAAEEADDDDEYVNTGRNENQITIGTAIIAGIRYFRAKSALYTWTKPTTEEVAETRASLRNSAAIVAVCAAVLVVAGVFVSLYTQLYTISMDIVSVRQDIEEELNEQVRLDAALASQASIDRVEKFAVDDLGMIKAADHKINYIDFSGEDSVVVCGGSECAAVDG